MAQSKGRGAAIVTAVLFPGGVIDKKGNPFRPAPGTGKDQN
jgi:hypothetical protein